ncbi:protein rolling stone-like [Neocloeon triangulifer]|uniref:protein rolling stone-like n=1 Tax=Neocloeon triangulifer TaxID=2078957 RepID=UPI00286F9FB9|nr:protein rolling stone-like [Neocloeon triangulifer]
MITAIIYTIKREFKAQSRNLTHDKPDRFSKSQWVRSESQKCTSIYLCYKWLIAAYLFVGLIITIVDIRTLGQLSWPENVFFRLKWAVYVTNWSAVIVFAQAVMAAVLATKHHLTSGQSDRQMTKLHKSYWLLNNMGNVLAPAVTLLYWTTVYNSKMHRLDFVNAHNHIMNSVVVAADLALAAHPVRLLHVYQPVLFAMGYGTFSAVYFLFGGTNRDHNSKIYPLLNWQKPGLAVAAVVAACLLLVVLHALVWLFYLLRRKIALFLVASPSGGQYAVQPTQDVPPSVREQIQLC